MMTEQCPNIWSDYIWQHVKLKNEERYMGRNGAYFQLDKTLPNARKTGPSKIEVKVLNYFQLPKIDASNSHYNTITTELSGVPDGAEVPNGVAQRVGRSF